MPRSYTFTADFAETDAYRVAYVTGDRYYAVIDTETGRETAQFDGTPEGHTHAYELACTLSSDAAEAAFALRADLADEQADRDAEAERLLGELRAVRVRQQWNEVDARAWQTDASKINGDLEKAFERTVAALHDLGYAVTVNGDTIELITPPAADEPVLYCESCGVALAAEDGFEADGLMVCGDCYGHAEDVPTPEQQAQRDAENETDMLDFLRSTDLDLAPTAHLTTPASAQALRNLRAAFEAALHTADPIVQELAAAALATAGVRDEAALHRLTQGDALALDAYVRGLIVAHQTTSIDLSGLAEPVRRAA